MLLPSVLKKYIKFVDKKLNQICEENKSANINIIISQYPQKQLIDINSKIK